MAISDHPLTVWGQVLEDERLRQGWSHEEVTKRAGLGSPSTWNTVVYGGREDRGEFKTVHPRPDTLAKLALVLGLDPADVLSKAGYQHVTVSEDIEYHLRVVPSIQLWLELRGRGELTKHQAAKLDRQLTEERNQPVGSRHAGRRQPTG